MTTILFNPGATHPLFDPLCAALGAEPGRLSQRRFPDGESFLRIDSEVKGRQVVVLADLTWPDDKFLPLCFLAETLRELGAARVGLVAPYLCYMRQDVRFHAGEAVTSRVFAQALSVHIDWLVTVDPHLHRYDSLDEIYTVPSIVVPAAPAMAQWIKTRYHDACLIGPDAESEQWVADIAARAGLPYIIGSKIRSGDRNVEIALPALDSAAVRNAVIVDDMISSGHTVLKAANELRRQGVQAIHCAVVHGVFADQSDAYLLNNGITELATTNTVAHSSNCIDVHADIAQAIQKLATL